MYRLGHIPDDYAPDKWVPIEKLIGAAPAPAPTESPGLIMWADRIESQPGSSCVGHAIAGAAYAKEGADNSAAGMPDRPRVFPAPLSIYYNACAKGGYPKRDAGCQPRLAYEGLTDYGYCAIEDWPSIDANLSRQPPASSYRAAADQRYIQYFRIVNDGAQACEDMRQALSKTNPSPVTLAFQVDESFRQLGSGIWTGPKGPILGGHYLWAVEYNFEYVTFANSWGRSYGVNGFGKVAWSAIADPKVTNDRYAITYAPTPMRAA